MTKDISLYSDYREYLRDFVKDAHSRNSTWSYAVWGRKLKVSSPSTLIMIVNGQRHPGPKLISSLVTYFNFDTKQEKYFRGLVELQKKVQDPKLSVYLLKQMEAEAAAARAAADADEQAPEDAVFSRDAYVLRELTALKDFQEDAEWIRDRLVERLEPKRIEDSLKTLEKIGLIERGEDGKLRPKTAVRSGTLPRPEQVKKLHRELIDATHAALEMPAELRSFHSAFLNIKADKIPEAKQLLLEFQKKFSELMEARPGDEVYQLNLQLFPVTKSSS